VPANREVQAKKRGNAALPLFCRKNRVGRKPGSVVGDHSSGVCVATALKQPTRIQCGQHLWIPIWPCSRWGLPCR